jgi:nitrate/nitrite transport system ATP-binding protein
MTRMADRRFVELYQLGKTYPNPYGPDVEVVKDVNLILRFGEFVSLIGHSGCGKSTVLTMLAGLNEITHGSAVIGGIQVTKPGPDRAVVFQAPCLLPWMTAYQNVRLGVDSAYPHASKADRGDICEYYLYAVGLGESMHRYPRELSAGMQQRAGIARAIALRPRLLLLDEPFGRLDSLTRMELQDVILNILDKEQTTTLLVTHDVDEALYMSDRICMMSSGPRAHLGQIIETPFARPRNRQEILGHDLYYDFRAALVSYLEQQDQVNGHQDDSTETLRTQVHIERLTDTNSLEPGDSAETVRSENGEIEREELAEPVAAG